MNISDIITLVTLAIAILAILNEKNRRHLLLKFHIVDYIFFGFAFLLINYFVFYDGFIHYKIYLRFLYFTDFGLNNPKHFAYIIAMVSLFYFFYKIWFSFYPYFNRQKVINFYNHLIENNDTLFLLDLIEKYHKKDIFNFIDNYEDYDAEPTNYIYYRFKKESIKEKINEKITLFIRYSLPFSKSNRHVYASWVLYDIINNPAFIAIASIQRPYFFAELFSHFKEIKRDAFPNELINSFLKELLKDKNFWLIKELKESQGNNYGQSDDFHENNKIISSFLTDLSVANVNEIWHPFIESAIEELEEERILGYESKMFQEFRDEKFLWNYKTFLAIQFLKILMIEVIIYDKNKKHFWSIYYGNITDVILKTFKKYPPRLDVEKKETIYHGFIEIIIENHFLWINISNENEDDVYYNNILGSLGSIIHMVCNSFYFMEERKVSYIDKLFRLYCNLDENKKSDDFRKKIAEKLVKPSFLLKENDIYFNYIETAWKDFDKIPHRTNIGKSEDLEYFKQFKEDVIIPLGLDPDLY